MASDGRLSFTPSPQIEAYLENLRKMGIYGKKLGDVINFIISKEVTGLLKDGILLRLPPDQEGEDETER